MKPSEDIQFPLTLILSHKVRGNDREMVLPPGERKKRKNPFLPRQMKAKKESSPAGRGGKKTFPRQGRGKD